MMNGIAGDIIGQLDIGQDKTRVALLKFSHKMNKVFVIQKSLPDLFCFPITRKLNDGKQVPRLLLEQLCGEIQDKNIFCL